MHEVNCQYIAWVIIIFGWLVIHFLSATRDRHKDIRESIHRLFNTILEIESKAVKFHQSINYDQEAARSLLTEISRLIESISQDPLNHMPQPLQQVKQFRRSITLRNFDLSNFHPLPPNSPHIAKITLATDELKSAISLAYSTRYTSHWWQIFRL